MLRPLAGAWRSASVLQLQASRWPRARSFTVPVMASSRATANLSLPTELAGLVRVLVARKHLTPQNAENALATLDRAQPLHGGHVGALKKAFKALHRSSTRGSRDPVAEVPTTLLAAVSAGMAVLPAKTLAWRSSVARKAVGTLLQTAEDGEGEEGEGGGGDKPPVTLLSACHALLAVSTARDLAKNSPDLAVVAAALARALTEVVTAESSTPLAVHVSDAAARLAQKHQQAAAAGRLRGTGAAQDEIETQDVDVAMPAVSAAAVALLTQHQASWLLSVDSILQSETRAEMGAVHAVRDAMAKAIPGCSLQVFGSRAAGLHLPGSDVDLLLRLPPQPRPQKPGSSSAAQPKPSREMARDALYSAKRALSRARLLDANVLLLPRARVPLLRFTTPNGMRCDLSCDGGDECSAAATGPAAAEWALQQATAEPALRPLVLSLKALVRAAHLDDPSTGGVGGHALTNMAVAYLRSAHAPGGAGTAVPPANLSAGHLLLGCLHFYGRVFDYSTTAISVRETQPFMTIRSAVRQGWAAPRRRHVHGQPQLKKGLTLGDGPVQLLRLHIRDPLQDEADVGAPTTRVSALAEYLAEAFDALTKQNAQFSQLLGRLGGGADDDQDEEPGWGGAPRQQKRGTKRWRGAGGGKVWRVLRE